jgi:hypothetical protein
MGVVPTKAVEPAVAEDAEAHRHASAVEVAGLLARLRDLGAGSPELLASLAGSGPGGLRGRRQPTGRVRKVSVSMPEDLTATVQRRVGRGEFSLYVTEAVTRQLELDLLAELAALLEAEHGPIPEGMVAEAAAAWPDAG